MGEFEKEIPWSWGKSIGTIWFDMDCDGTVDYVKKMFKPSKIDQVINFYGIPYVYKNEYKKYLKYRIQARHYWVVNDYFSVILRSEWYDTSDFDFWKLQDEYNMKVPVAEATWLDLHINYNDFLEKDRAHREALEKWNESKKDEQIWQMQSMMQKMMEQMEQLQKQVWQPNVLLSKENNNDWQQPSWSDNGTNATNTIEPTEETTLQEDGENWINKENSTWWDDWHPKEMVQWDGERTQWTELIWGDGITNNWWDWLGWGNTEPFKIWNETKTTTTTEWEKKDRRTA